MATTRQPSRSAPVQQSEPAFPAEEYDSFQPEMLDRSEEEHPEYRPHKEASWVAFTRADILGQDWSITLREGTTPSEIERMFHMLAQCRSIGQRVLKEYGAEFSPMPVSEMPRSGASPSRPSSPASSPPAGQRGPLGGRGTPPEQPSQGGGVFQIAKLVITGTLDKPVVEMWDVNDRLRFPQMKVPSHIVLKSLRERYEGSSLRDSDWKKIESDLTYVGSSKAINWWVYWVPSAKDNGKYKDLDFIISDSLEDHL